RRGGGRGRWWGGGSQSNSGQTVTWPLSNRTALRRLHLFNRSFHFHGGNDEEFSASRVAAGACRAYRGVLRRRRGKPGAAPPRGPRRRSQGARIHSVLPGGARRFYA